MDIVRNEDCIFLTDRWGDWNGNTQSTPERLGAVDRLLPAMWDEYTFITLRGEHFGLLAEFEFDDGREPNATQQRAALAVSELFPGVTVWQTQGDHVFNGRHAFRAFIPESIATAKLTESVCRIIFERAFGEVAS